jgi:hypothetical protein
MQIHQREVAVINFFRATELHGALILGQLVRRTSDPRLIVELTRCSAQQMAYSQQLAEKIVALGGSPAPVRATYQDLLAEIAGAPVTLVEVLVMTQAAERLVRQTESRWIQSWLDDHARRHGAEVSDVKRRYSRAEAKIARLSEGNRSAAFDNLGKSLRVPVGKPNAAV